MDGSGVGTLGVNAVGAALPMELERVVGSADEDAIVERLVDWIYERGADAAGDTAAPGEP